MFISYVRDPVADMRYKVISETRLIRKFRSEIHPIEELLCHFSEAGVKKIVFCCFLQLTDGLWTALHKELRQHKKRHLV